MSQLPLTPSFTRAIGSTLDVVGVGDNRIGTHRTIRRAMIGRPQPATQDELAADDKQRQEAMVVVITVKELALLITMDRIVGGIEIQDNLPGRFVMALHKQPHKKAVKSTVIGYDLLVAILPCLVRQAEFEAVQRARCRQRMTTVPLAGPPLTVHIIDPAGQGQGRSSRRRS